MLSRTRAILAPLLVAAALLSACAGSSGTTASATVSVSADAEAVFRDFTEAVNTGDAAAAAALVAEDAEFYGDRAADIGVEGIVAQLGCTVDIVSADVQGDTAEVEIEFTGLSPLAAPGIDCPEGTVGQARVTVRDGKIVAITDVD